MFCGAVTPGHIPVYIVHFANKEILILIYTILNMDAVTLIFRAVVVFLEALVFSVVELRCMTQSGISVIKSNTLGVGKIRPAKQYSHLSADDINQKPYNCCHLTQISASLKQI